MKKVTKKIVIKEKVQGREYWVKRPINDKQKDWNYEGGTWVDGYVQSTTHPHRLMILNALEEIKPFGGVLEVGCSTGPNLINIASSYSENQLAGIDVNDLVLEKARELLPKAIIKNGSVMNIPFGNKEFDVILCDAVLMYIGPDEIDSAMSELDRVAKKAIIIVDRHADSLVGEVTGHVWGRNYKVLLQTKGFEVKETKITENRWPDSKNWAKFGRLYIAVRQ